VLDGTSPASGRVAALAALSRDAEAVEQLSRLQDAPSLEPLTPLPRPEWGARERSRSPVADPAFPGRTSMRPASAGSRRLPPGKLGASTFAGTRPELRARWPAGAMAARVHRCSRTSTRPSTTRLRGRLQAACASTASADRCFNEHGQGPLEHPVPAQCGQGRLNVRSIVAFRSSSRRRYAGSGAEDHRILGAPSRDCSRERLRPDPDRFRLLASRSLRVTLPGGGMGDRQSRQRRATLARHGRRQGPGTPDLREEIRRAGARGAFRRKAVRERGWTVEGPKPVRWSSPAPFSLPVSRTRDARTVPGSPAFR